MRDPAVKLGRGLALLLGQDHATYPGDALQPIPLTAIGPNPFQPRREIDPASLGDLAASIAQQGVLQPVLVRMMEGANPPYRLIAGERRWRAAAQAGLSEIPCVVRRMSDSEAAMAALVENLQREDLNPLDEAEGFQLALNRFGLTQDTLAKAVGKSRSHVANTVRLLNLPESVRQELRGGRLSAGHARALLTHPNPEQAARRVIAEGLNVRQTEALAAIADKSETSSDSPRRPRDPDLAALESELTGKLGLAISIVDRGGCGRVTIAYRNLDQLDGIVALLNAC